ncbi:MAG: rod shape-determining protein MreC, partial [Bacteroidales bacterium]|nr:rod shape-determining protein MreC [Bacteroidales bacterium]
LWDGGSYRDAILSDIPEHAVVEIGDTVLTSGASAFFPEGLMVGVVNSLEPDRNGGFYDIGVRLAVDFNALYDVQVIECSDADERVGLEASVPDK